jgi:hypothetical protein
VQEFLVGLLDVLNRGNTDIVQFEYVLGFEEVAFYYLGGVLSLFFISLISSMLSLEINHTILLLIVLPQLERLGLHAGIQSDQNHVLEVRVDRTLDHQDPEILLRAAAVEVEGDRLDLDLELLFVHFEYFRMFEIQNSLPATKIIQLQLLFLDIDHTLIIILVFQVVFPVLFVQIALDVDQPQFALVTFLGVHGPERTRVQLYRLKRDYVVQVEMFFLFHDLNNQLILSKVFPILPRKLFTLLCLNSHSLCPAK